MRRGVAMPTTRDEVLVMAIDPDEETR